MPSLPHQLLLLELDDDTGTSLLRSDSLTRSLGLAGAIVAELQLRDRLVPVAADRFVLAEGPPSEGALGLAEARLPARPRPLKALLSRLSNRIRPIRRALLEELVEAGALRREADRLWFVTWRTRWTTADPALEESVRRALRHWVRTADDGTAPTRDDLLLSLLRCADLLGTVWSEDELATLRPAIDVRTAMAPIGRTVATAVNETRAAIVAAAAGS